jgi:hypothetical protein
MQKQSKETLQSHERVSHIHLAKQTSTTERSTLVWSIISHKTMVCGIFL